MRAFHGYKLRHKYIEYFQLLIFNWVCVIISCLVTKLINIDRLLFISLIGLIVEVLFSLIALKFVGRRKTLSIIKGGE
ncbi:MAG: hypothetical protein GX275_09540 [Clostridiales bacterium]|nr:hypothetical protein [Clostridiales bacterium]